MSILATLLGLFIVPALSAQELLWGKGPAAAGFASLAWALHASLGVLTVLCLQQLWVGWRQRDPLSFLFAALLVLQMLWCLLALSPLQADVFGATGLLLDGLLGVLLCGLALSFLASPEPLPWLRGQLLPIAIGHVLVALAAGLGFVLLAQWLALLATVALLVVLFRAALDRNQQGTQALAWFVVSCIPWLLACALQLTHELGLQHLLALRPTHWMVVLGVLALGQSLALQARQLATLRAQLSTQTRLLAAIQTREQQLQQQLHDRLDDLRRHQQQLDEQSYMDALTGLPNRRLFSDRFALTAAQARRKDKMFALAVLDLDHFAQINEQRGHVMGDTVLQEVGRRISQSLRSTDTLARLGGDEFGLILHDPEDRDAVALVCTRILNSVRGDLVCMGFPIQVSLSMGVAFFQDDGATLDALYNAAEGAMRAVKRKGRNGFQWAS